MIRSKLYYLIPVLCLGCLCLDANTYHVPSSSSGGSINRSTSLNSNSLTHDTTGPQGNQLQTQFNYNSETGTITLPPGTYTTPTGETYMVTSPQEYNVSYSIGQNGNEHNESGTGYLPDGDPIKTEYMYNDYGVYRTITGPNGNTAQGSVDYNSYLQDFTGLGLSGENYQATITAPNNGSGSYTVTGPDQTKTGTYDTNSGTFQVPSTIYLPNGNTLETNGSTVTRDTSVSKSNGDISSTYTWE